MTSMKISNCEKRLNQIAMKTNVDVMNASITSLKEASIFLSWSGLCARQW